jgi:hypothetical protein
MHIHYIKQVAWYIYCRRKQQFFVAFISNATCFGPYGPTSGTEYTSETQVWLQVNIRNFRAHKFYSRILNLKVAYISKWLTFSCLFYAAKIREVTKRYKELFRFLHFWSFISQVFSLPDIYSFIRMCIHYSLLLACSIYPLSCVCVQIRIASDQCVFCGGFFEILLKDVLHM